mgnify:FL=1
MNLIDLLAPKVPKPQTGLAETAEVAESQLSQALENPPPLAGSGGKEFAALKIRHNPPLLAEIESSAITGFPPNPPNSPAQAVIVEKAVPLTREYFAAQGVELLREDMEFLFSTLMRNRAIRQYITLWVQAIDCEPVSHRKANRGRFAANTWLRECRV